MQPCPSALGPSIGWDVVLQVVVAQQEQEEHGFMRAGAVPGALAEPSKQAPSQAVTTPWPLGASPG